MLDHVFIDVIGALRKAFEAGFLERQALEERFQVDVLLGDLSWETSYSLPGEGMPPRVRADISLDWPTWSQSAYRSWSIGEASDDPPEIGIEIVLRIQRLADGPDIDAVMKALPDESPPIGSDTLERSGPTIEQTYNDDMDQCHIAVEVSYEGTYRFDDESMRDAAVLESHVASLGSWVGSTLVRLGDLKLNFQPPEPEEDDG